MNSVSFLNLNQLNQFTTVKNRFIQSDVEHPLLINLFLGNLYLTIMRTLNIYNWFCHIIIIGDSQSTFRQ